MAYAFNDDKSKQEVYTKDDFCIITGSVSLSANNSKNVIINNETLLNDYGISDISDWIPIAYLQSGAGTTNHWYSIYTTSFAMKSGVEISVGTGIYNGLYIIVHNGDTNAGTVYYKVVLMKIS